MEHLNDIIISKGSRKVNVLSGVMAYTSLSKTKKLVNSLLAHNLITTPLFGCSIVVFLSLRLWYEHKSSSFEKLLEQEKSVTIHTRNLQIVATEMFKVYWNIFPLIFGEIFHRRGIDYNLQINSEFAMPNVRSVFHGSGSISYLGPKIWDSLQSHHEPF